MCTREPRLVLVSLYPGPRGFSWTSREPRSSEDELRSGEKRKTSGYLGLESHFHADARVRIWPSCSDWLIFLQTRKPIWLVRLIGNTKGTRDCEVTISPFWNYQFDAFDSWRLHESEIQVQGNQRFFSFSPPRYSSSALRGYLAAQEKPLGPG